MEEDFAPPHGGYAKLLSYQKSLIVYQGTVHFCESHLPRSTRTRDQMIQAARSTKQNIVEGSQASGHSKETELLLTGVARSSLEELLEDYRDFLRSRNSPEWPTDHPNVNRLRERNRSPDCRYETLKGGIENSDPCLAANVMIGMIKLTSYLLDRQLATLRRSFLMEGGIKERMTAARRRVREISSSSRSQN